MVKMNHTDISNDIQPIICTQALATCVGVLIYSVDKKKAIVSHVSENWRNSIYQTIDLILKNKLCNSTLKYKIIPGYYHNKKEIVRELENCYKSHSNMFIPFDENEILENSIHTDEETTSREFAFDASTGKFITDEIFFNSNSSNILNFNKKR